MNRLGKSLLVLASTFFLGYGTLASASGASSTGSKQHHGKKHGNKKGHHALRSLGDKGAVMKLLSDLSSHPDVNATRLSNSNYKLLLQTDNDLIADVSAENTLIGGNTRAIGFDSGSIDRNFQLIDGIAEGGDSVSFTGIPMPSHIKANSLLAQQYSLANKVLKTQSGLYNQLDQMNQTINTNHSTVITKIHDVRDKLNVKIEKLDSLKEAVNTHTQKLTALSHSLTKKAGIKNLNKLRSNFDEYKKTANSDIEANKENIASNLATIQANSAAVLVNKIGIAQNTSDITQNKAAIAVNTANISLNTRDIAANQKDISLNAQNIATNASNIANNLSLIKTNIANIGLNKKAIIFNVGQIKTLNDQIQRDANLIHTNAKTGNVNASLIHKAALNIHKNAAALVHQNELLQQTISSVHSNAQGINKNLGLIQTTLSGVQANATQISQADNMIKVNASNIASNASSIHTNAEDVVSLAKSQQQNLLLSDHMAQTQQVLEKNIDGNTSLIGQVDQRVNTNEGNISQESLEIANNTRALGNVSGNFGANETIAGEASNIATIASMVAKAHANAKLAKGEVRSNIQEAKNRLVAAGRFIQKAQGYANQASYNQFANKLDMAISNANTAYNTANQFDAAVKDYQAYVKTKVAPTQAALIKHAGKVMKNVLASSTKLKKAKRATGRFNMRTRVNQAIAKNKAQRAKANAKRAARIHIKNYYLRNAQTAPQSPRGRLYNQGQESEMLNALRKF